MQKRYIVNASKQSMLNMRVLRCTRRKDLTCLTTEELIPGATRSGKRHFKVPVVVAATAAIVVVTTGKPLAPVSADLDLGEVADADVVQDAVATCALPSCCC